MRKIRSTQQKVLLLPQIKCKISIEFNDKHLFNDIVLQLKINVTLMTGYSRISSRIQFNSRISFDSEFFSLLETKSYIICCHFLTKFKHKIDFEIIIKI
jgi:hypothetical protein